ncbi:MAG: peptide-methionine (S)-S-oxide reductase MsrA [Patescibacteria group bacterium]
MTETIVFGGGCFWCTEAIFKMLKGVESVEPGYAGGTTDNPSYQTIGDHAEVVKVEFDPAKIEFSDLLTVFFATHDPTTPNQQGADIGSQYRSLILFTTLEQETDARKFIDELNDSSEFGEPIVTEIKPLEKFYPAEAEHPGYYQRNQNTGYCQVVINPKLQKVKSKFSQLLAE